MMITTHTKSIISSCHASAHVINTLLDIGGPKQSIISLAVRNFFHYMRHPSLVQCQIWMKYFWWELAIAEKSVQHVTWGIYGTDSVDTWTCAQDLVKSMRHEHMVLLCRNSVLNHRCKMGFTASNWHNDLTNVCGLIQASHPEGAECNVSWCAMLSPPPTDFPGSQGVRSTGTDLPAQY